MNVTEWKSPGTLNPTNYFTYPENTKVIDGNPGYIILNKNTVASCFYQWTSCGFLSSDIPDGATIDGIEVQFARHASAGEGYDHTLSLVSGDVPVGSNYASATQWETSTTTKTYGGATDKWGTSLTRANILSTGFGIGIQPSNGGISDMQHINIDGWQIRVYYTDGGGGLVLPIIQNYKNNMRR